MFKSRNKGNCNFYNGVEGNTRMQIVFFPLKVELFTKKFEFKLQTQFARNDSKTHLQNIHFPCLACLLNTEKTTCKVKHTTLE